MMLVGAKADLPRALTFEEASAAARARGLPYVECVAVHNSEVLEGLPDVGPMYRLALAMAAALEDLTGMPTGEADRATATNHQEQSGGAKVQHFISEGFLSELKTKAERDGAVVEGVGKNDDCYWCPQHPSNPEDSDY